MSKDISNIIKRAGVNLEPNALSAFGASTPERTLGAALDSRSSGNFVNTGASRNLSPDTVELNRTWDSTRYASTMASGRGGFDPKIKFLFRVTFAINPDVRESARELLASILDKIDRNLTYIIKSIDMPKYKFLYDEYNYYNFRTKMLKKIEHEPLSFVFYDDIGNSGLDFINTYLQLLSPIHRNSWTTNSPLENLGLQPNFEDMLAQSSAQRSVLGTTGNAKHILDQIIIDQYYLDRSDPNVSDARQAIKMNTFIFKNPRLESFDIDGNDYEEGQTPHMINCTFDFDALFIETTKPGEGTDGTGLMEAYDILSGAGESPRNSGSIVNSAGGGGRSTSPYDAVISNQSRTQFAVDNILNRPSFSSGGAQGLLQNAGSILNTLSSRRPLSNVVSSGITRALPPIVSDPAIGGLVLGQIRSRIGGG